MSQLHSDAKSEASIDVVLDVAELKSGYSGIPVLRGVSFELREGEAIGIVGHNGMGKSTLLKTLVGLVPATAGRVSIDGLDVTRMPAHERSRLGIGYVPQGRGIMPGLTALENLRLGWSEDSGDTEQAALERVLDTLPRLNSVLDRKGGSLSGGEQQILALGRALMPAPWLLVLDEPSEGIQPSIVQEIGEILANLRKKEKLSLIVVEQNLDLVLDVADRIFVMERGQVEREMAISSIRSGGLSELLGMGAARMTRDSRPSAKAGTQSSMLPRAPSPTGAAKSSASSDIAYQASPKPAGPSSMPQHRHQDMRSTRNTANTTSAQRAESAPRAAAPVNTDRGDPMTRVKRPTHQQLSKIVESLHMSMSDAEVAEYLEVIDGTLAAYDKLAGMPDYLPEVRYPRTPGHRPSARDNPLGAWAVKTDVKGAPYGPLTGKTIVLKDNICLAGVPMMNGSSTLEGYVPDVDATLVTRILDAGGTIVGKAVCEHFCLSGGSHTSSSGPVHNPYKIGYSTGGSSSGSGALVAAGEVDMAIGGDQGGSIRIPASWCGLVGMKATHGLVPYTGVMPIEATIDHAGPMTTTVADNALLLEVIAGEDGLDPRQYNVRTDKYTSALGKGAAGLRIGLLTEGFELDSCEPDVVEKVRLAAERLRKLGAIVENVSVPMHMDGPAIWSAIALEGLTAQMMHGNGMGFNWEGMYTTSLLDAHASWRAKANELSRTLKLSMMVGEYFITEYRGHFYAKAQNLARMLRSAYDDALSRYDMLLMPTLPMKATPLPPLDAPLSLWCQRGFEMLTNTQPFDVTGHPAITVPCGMSAGLPIGMMLVAKHYNESILYRAAHAFEQSGDWRDL